MSRVVNRDTARDLIIEMAISGGGEQMGRLAAEEELVRRHLAQTRAEIGRLLEILKAQGTKALSSINNELVRREGEERLGRAITQLAERQHPPSEKAEAAGHFLRTWKWIGELLDDLPAEEKQQILQHYMEVIEFRETDATGKVGGCTPSNSSPRSESSQAPPTVHPG